MQSEFNAKAQSRQDAIGLFLLRNQETRNHRKNLMASWLHYVELFLVAPLRLGVFALKVFCMMADCKVWPAAKTGRPQGPGQKANGQRMAGPGPDWPGLPQSD